MQEQATAVEPLLQLAIFREITTLYVDPKQMKQFVPEVKYSGYMIAWVGVILCLYTKFSETTGR